MLQTNKSWEYKSRGQALGVFFPGIRHYPFVEIPLNRYIFHVDVVLGEKYQNNLPWSRFIFDDVIDVLQFIKRNDVIEIRLSLQSRRCGDAEYAISLIVEIVEAKDRSGHKTYLYRCSNNICHIDSYSVDSENELSDQRTIWSRSI